MRTLALLGMVVALVVSAVSDARATEHETGTVAVEVRVWQDMEDARTIHVGARSASGSWRTLGMVPLALDDGVTRSGYRYGDITLDVAIPDWEPPIPIEVRVWQHPLPEIIYISARPAGGSWLTLGTVRLLLDDGITPTGERFGDIRLDVPLPPAEVTTIAGQPRVSGYADGPGSEALFGSSGFGFRLGLAVDRDGSVVVADHTNQAIRRILPDGSVTTIAGGTGWGVLDGPAETAQFAGPTDVAIAPDGSIYVADYFGHRIRRIAPDGMVTTVAGGGRIFGPPWEAYGEGSWGAFADGRGSDARFSFPGGIVIDKAGGLYVIEGNGRIRRISPSGEVTTFAGTAQLGQHDGHVSNAGFFTLLAIDIDARGNLYVIDHRDDFATTVRKISADGIVETLIRTVPPYRGGTFAHPTGLAVTGDGDIYLSNTGRHQVVWLTRAGQLRAVAGTGVAGHANGALDGATFNRPGAIAFAPDGTLVVADGANHVIRRITLRAGRYGPPALELAGPQTIPRVEGVTIEVFAGRPGYKFAGVPRFTDGAAGEALFYQPWAMALDADGNVIVADSENHAIRRVAPDGSVTTIAGGNGEGVLGGACDQAQFHDPQGVAVDAEGFIFVADSRSNRIRRISPDCIVTTVAGGGPVSPERVGNWGEFRDGPAAQARFRKPAGLVFDHKGNLLIVERGHSRIRKLSPEGIVSTIAGAASLPGFGRHQGNSGSRDGPGHSALFHSPEGITVDAEGNIFFTESNNNVRMIDERGFVSTVLRTPVTRHGGELSPFLGGIAVGADGALYVADSHYNRVVRITREGMLSIVGEGLDLWNTPQGILALPDGSLLVSDSGDNVIRKITFDGGQ